MQLAGRLSHHGPDVELVESATQAVLLSPAAIQVLSALPRRPDNPWVFPGRVRGTRLRTLNASWQVVRKEAGLEDVRLHDLRHRCATTSFLEEIFSALRHNLPLLSHCYSLRFSIISKLGQPRLMYSRQFA